MPRSAAARAQDARGWSVDEHVDRAGDGRAVVKVDARDATARR